MKNSKIISTITSLCLVFLIAGCRSPQKMIESGNYDEAVEFAIKKLKGKTKKKAKYVNALETAFEKATEKDMNRIAYLKLEEESKNWEKILNLYQDIDRRQKAIEPLLPVIDREGYEAEFRFVKVAKPLKEAKYKTAYFLYDESNALLAKAKTGDKRSARIAYEKLMKVDHLINGFENTHELINTSLELGKTNYLFKMENDAFVILPFDFEREILRMSVRDVNNIWNEFDLEPVNGKTYDFDIKMRLTEIVVSPDLYKERSFTENKKIEDGFEYLLDKNGNVRKDSLGNDIKIPKDILVYADIVEVFQNKNARVAGRLEIFDKQSNQLIDSSPLGVDAILKTLVHPTEEMKEPCHLQQEEILETFQCHFRDQKIYCWMLRNC